MAIVLEASLTLSPNNQIAYLSDSTGLVADTVYVVTGTYITSDTRFTYRGNLDITLTKQPLGVPASNTIVAAEITTVPLAAPTPPPAIYPYSVKDRLIAANLNDDLEFSPGPLPPQSALGGAGKYKYWVDTSVTPAVLRQCVVARASLVYVAAEWVTVGTVDGTGFKLSGAGGTLTGPLTLSGAPTLPLHATTKAYVDTFAPLASPVFTGYPRAPTPATADNDTSIATTAYVKAQGPFLPLAGGTLTGNLTAPGIHVTNNVIVDGPLSVGGQFTAVGGTFSGNVFHNGACVVAYGIQYPNYGLGSPATNIGLGYDYGNGFLWIVANGVTAGYLGPVQCDERLKRDVRPISVDPLAALCRVQLKAFNQLSTRNDPADGVRPRDVGFIAQQLREIIPNAVIEPPPGMEGERYLGLDLMPLVAYCVGAIQQLTARLEALEGT